MVKSVTTVCERSLNFYVWFLKIYTIVTDLTIQTIVTYLIICNIAQTIVTYLTILTIVKDLTISVQVAKA